VLAFQPAANERDDAEGGTVQPLRVVEIRTSGTESATSQMSWKAATAMRNESGLRSTPRAECRLEGLPL